jgi:hypothetical protein
LVCLVALEFLFYLNVYQEENKEQDWKWNWERREERKHEEQKVNDSERKELQKSRLKLGWDDKGDSV